MKNIIKSNKLLGLLLLFMFVCVHAQAQQMTITGQVYDKSDMPLIGVNVIEKGNSTNGTITDFDGKFILKVKKPNSVLVASYIGYKSKEIPLKGKKNIKIILDEDSEMLGEVTVVAYGVQKKETMTGAISSVGTDALVQSPNASVGNALAGKIVGLSSVQNSGQPGEEDPSIYIRGVGGLSESASKPLILVDGVERSFFQMDPNEIESISVLKDASATAVFGVRGANGVILVTTRRGKEGKAKISINSSVGVTQITRMLEMAGSYDYAIYNNEMSDNDNANRAFDDYAVERFKKKDSPILYPDIDWRDYMMNPSAIQTQHNMNISGGNKTMRYFVSLGFLYQNGNFKDLSDKEDDTYHYNRYNYRTNLDLNITKSTLLKIGIGGIIGDTHSPAKSSSLWESFSNSQPFAGAGIIDGRVVRTDDSRFSTIKINNPLQQYYNYGYSDKLKNTMNLDMTLTQKLDFITKGLSVEVKGAYNTDYTFTTSRTRHTEVLLPFYESELDGTGLAYDDPNFNNNVVYKIDGYNEKLNYAESTSRGRNWYMEGSIRYNRKFGGHNVGALLLYNQSKKYYPSQFNAIPTAYVGLAGRITYDYKSRYMAEFNVGRNGSENFSPNKRYGLFPAFSAGYIISEEPFMKKQNIVSYLKLRASIGKVGNDNLGSNRFLYLPDSYVVDYYGSNDIWAAYGGGYNFGYNDKYILPGALEQRFGNPDVTWETALKQNYGVDAYFLKSKLKLTADMFFEDRTDILINRSTIPNITGLNKNNLPVVNMGEVKNHGYELTLKWADKINNDLDYYIEGNMSYSKNKIIFQDEVEPNEPYMKRTGNPVGTIFGKRFDRMYQKSDFDITTDESGKSIYTLKEGYAVPLYKVQPGDVKYKDLNKDNVIDEDDVEAIGYPSRPEYTFGLNLGGNYKGFFLSMNWTGTAHRSLLLADGFKIPFCGEDRGLASYLIPGHWQDGICEEDATTPRFSKNMKENNYCVSDLWLKDASYIRLKNLTIGYNFDTKASFFKHLGVKQCSVKLSGYNLLTIDALDILDPEAKAGWHTDTYPITKTYNLGVNLSF